MRVAVAGPVSRFQKRTIDAFDLDLVPVPSSQVLNQDETTMVCTLGNETQDSTVRCVRLAPASADNSYHNDHADPNERKVEATQHLRIQKFTMFGAGGETTAPFLSIGGRTDREMPVQEGEEDDPAAAGIVVLRLPAMVQNAHKNPHLRQPTAAALAAGQPQGTIIFSRKTPENGGVGKSSAGKVARHHKELVANPFIAAIVDGNGHIPGADYEPKHTVVLYRDGCGPALLEDIRPDSCLHDDRHRITQIKGNPAATATQQASDVADLCRTEKKAEKSMVPEGEHELQLSDTTHKAIMGHAALNIKPAHAKCIADFGAIQSRLEEISNTATKTSSTFARLGYVDAATKTTPDPDAAFGNTTRSTITADMQKEFWELYPRLVRQYDELGRTPESTWMSIVENSWSGMPADTTSTGAEIWRDKGVTSIGEQRIQRIGAPAIVAEREAVREAVRAEKRRKIEGVATKTNGTIANAKACVDQLAKATGGSHATATLEQVHEVNAPLLGDHVLSRTLTGPKPRGHPKHPVKGTLQDAKTAVAGTGAPTLTSVAHQLMGKPMTMTPPAAPAADADDAPRPPLSAGTSVGFKGNIHAAAQPAASAMLANPAWFKRLGDSLHFCTTLGDHTPDGKRADSVCEVLLAARLPAHILRTLPDDKKKQEDQCWTFAAENMSRVVALLEAGGLLKRDVSGASSDTCLLRRPTGQWLPASSAPAGLEGACAFWDKELGKWVRCGKVSGVGRTIRVRRNEHETASKLLTPEHRGSTFYRAHRHEGPGHDGVSPCFQDLECYAVMGFLRSDRTAINAMCSEGPDGLFVWSAATLRAASACRFTTAAVPLTVEAKKLHMVSYLFETAAQLACSPNDNLSRSPSFEALLRVFGATD